MYSVDMNHLCFLASDPERHGFLKELLFSLDVRIWPNSTDDGFSRAFDHISGALSGYPQLYCLFQLRLIAEFLVFRRNMPKWAGTWVHRHLDLSRYLPGISPQSLEKSVFCAVPVFVCLDRGRMRCFIAGLVPETVSLWPGWAAPLMEDSCCRAIETAAAAVQRQIPLPENYSLFCCPLTIENNKIQFAGGSLALPVALGFMSLLSGRGIAGHLAATGGLDPAGKVTKVGNLSCKAGCAADNYHGMLYPVQNHPAPAQENFDLIPVADLDKAWMVARLYSTENRNMLELCIAMLDDPQLFVRNCTMVPIHWLTWIHRHGKDQKTIEKTAASPGLFSHLAGSFEQSLENWDLERCRALGAMIDDHVLDHVQSTAPLAVFNWCRLNLALSNHLGETVNAGRWIQRAGSLVGRVMGADVETVAEYYNHFLVFQHNNYCFPAILPPDLESVLALLERVHAVLQSEGCPVYPVLGRLYGSLAQHHAFRGPDSMETVSRYSEKARTALGEPAVYEYKDQWLRQYGYLTYACLDAGLSDEAGKHFLTYLEAEDLQQAVSRASGFSMWQHALTARFLADTDHPGIAGVYLKWAAVSKNNPCKTGHPWQLWALNMARIAQKTGDEPTARILYRKSLDLCLADNSGPAIRVMALMPLARLETIGGFEKKMLPAIKRKIMTAVDRLDPDHFSILKNKTFDEVISEAGQHLRRLFPFTYR